MSWCHGAPGIALARMCLRGTAVADAEVPAELRVALEATADPNATPSADSLCCGNLGRAAILRMAVTELGEDVWLEAARSLERRVMRARDIRGMYASTHSPGLFQGLSGIGLALLETADESVTVIREVLSAGLLSRGRGRAAGQAAVAGGGP